MIVAGGDVSSRERGGGSPALAASREASLTQIATEAETVGVVLTPHHVLTRRLLSLTNVIGDVAKAGAGVLLAGIVVCVSLGVFTRYALDRPLVWTEEVSLRAYVWMCFLGLIHLTHRQLLFGLPVVANRLPYRLKLLVRIAAAALTGVICFILLDWGRVVLVNVSGIKSAALGMPAWSLYAAAPVAAAACLVILSVHVLCLVEMTVRGEVS